VQSLFGVEAIDEGTEPIAGIELFGIDGNTWKILSGQIERGSGADLIVGVEEKAVKAVRRIVVHGFEYAVDKVAGSDVVTEVGVWVVWLRRLKWFLGQGDDPGWSNGDDGFSESPHVVLTPELALDLAAGVVSCGQGWMTFVKWQKTGHVVGERIFRDTVPTDGGYVDEVLDVFLGSGEVQQVECAEDVRFDEFIVIGDVTGKCREVDYGVHSVQGLGDGLRIVDGADDDWAKASLIGI